MLKICATIASAISACFWMWSASLPSVEPIAYLSGPPNHIVEIMRRQSRLNALAAFFTAASVFLGILAELL